MRRMAPGFNVARARNLLRLRRWQHGQSLDNFDVIRAGYGNLGLPRWLDSYRLRGLSDTLRVIASMTSPRLDESISKVRNGWSTIYYAQGALNGTRGAGGPGEVLKFAEMVRRVGIT